MQVFVFPPRESLNNLVNLLSLISRWPECSTKAFMTRPSVSKLLLISPASLALPSLAPERDMFSDPARSTRFSFPHLIISSPSGVHSLM
nr:hypothetical protein BC937DRAFT_88563 [Ipomoea batatas]